MADTTRNDLAGHPCEVVFSSVSDNLGYGTKGLQFQSYKNAKKRVISCRCQEIYISLPHFTIKPTLMTHGNTREHPSSSLTIDDEWDGETFIEY